MKKRIYTIITFIISVCVMGQVDTVLAETDIGGGGTTDPTACDEAHPCYYAKIKIPNKEHELVQGIRVSIVDEAGNRVSGTRSYDFIKNPDHTTYLTTKKNLKTFLPRQYTKNEVLSGNITQPGIGRSYKVGVNVKTFAGLPEFMNIGANTKMLDYITGLDENQLQTNFFSYCGYNYKSDDNIQEHNILIEPLAYMRVTIYDDNGGYANVTDYYGTVTEISRMLQDDGIGLWPGYFGKMLPLGIYVRDYTDDNNVVHKEKAGLKSLTDLLNAGVNDFSNRILTSFGTAAGHVWLPDVVDNCIVNPGKLPECCYLPENRDKLPECCSLEENQNRPECNPSSCDYSLDTSVPGDCTDGTTGYVKDTDDWQCIYNSRTSSDPNARDHFYVWGNAYCSFYCREEVSFQYPSIGLDVLAGSHFTAGYDWYQPNLYPIHYKGISECRTEINWQRFVRDWIDANNDVADAWERYEIARVKQNSVNNTSSGAFVCNVYCDDPCPTYPCPDGKGICGGGCCGYYGPHDYERVPHSASYDGRNVTPGDFCPGRTPNFNVGYYKNVYDRAVIRRDNLKVALEQCNDWERSYSEFKPTVGFNYEEPIYGGEYYTLSKSGSTRQQTQYYITNSDIPSYNTYKRESLIDKYICTSGSNFSGNNCDTTKILYPSNDRLTQLTTKDYDYYLPSNIYRYVLKPSGRSSDTAPINGDNYIDLGYSNLPIHYSTPTGAYDFYLKSTSFGPNQKFNKFIFGSTRFRGSYYTSYDTKYDCRYNVTNTLMDDPRDPTPKPEGIDVVYRTISLSNPFPGSSGEGRNPGANWDRNDVEDYILHNRNLNDPEKIYFDREPMYEINLDMVAIKQIRSYNRIQSSNEQGGYADFELTCDTGTGRECKSDFIRTEFKRYFVSSRCGMSPSWNACEYSDNNKG